jgi:hypothetical protein
MAAIVVAVFILTGLANAALWDRGGGLIYDDVLNVTWLQNANYAMTSGYDADGGMDWYKATSWAANLSYYDSARGKYWDDWRLPQTRPVDGGTLNYNFAYNGSSDIGWNISAPNSAFPYNTGSELAYMYYVNLGNIGQVDINGNPIDPSKYGVKNSGPFFNLNVNDYWSSTPGPVDWYNGKGAFFFYYYHAGMQHVADKATEYAAWAVRDGDVGPATVPIPAGIWLMGSGVLGLGIFRGFKRSMR